MNEATFVAMLRDENTTANRRVYADWLEERGERTWDVMLDHRERYPGEGWANDLFADLCRDEGWTDVIEAMVNGRTKFSAVIELTIPQLIEDGNWAEVFADENSGNVSKKTDPCPPGSSVDLTEPTRADVVEIIAAVNGENDSDEWVGVFRLRDGRHLLASGSCDCTGWG